MKNTMHMFVVGVFLSGVGIGFMFAGQPGEAGPSQPEMTVPTQPMVQQSVSAGARQAHMPLATSLQERSARKIAAGLFQDQTKKQQIIEGTFDWESLGIANPQLALVKRVFARDYYLQTGKDIGNQLGVDIGGFSIAELLDHGRIPAAVPGNRRLDLSFRKINDMGGFERITGLTKLQVLELTGNQLTALPVEIGRLTNLLGLDLSKNRLTTLPAETGKLTNLQELVLSKNQLASLPAEIGSLTKLLRINLSDNQFTTLPAWIGNLTNLHALSFSDNQLTSLPAWIGNLTNLAGLWLSDNQLTVLPAEIGNLTKLTWFDFSDNQLTTLPAWIGSLINLHALSFSGNQLTALPADIRRLTNLQYLSFSNNQFTTLPVEIGNLTNLRWLDLTDNPLQGIAAKIHLGQELQKLLQRLRAQAGHEEQRSQAAPGN